MRKNLTSGGRGGGYCCDHCSDSKFPCVFMEKKMRQTRGNDRSSPAEGEAAVEKASDEE